MKPIEKIILYFLALLAFVSFAWWQQDDFYIHLQYAKHLLHDREWSFNQGAPAYGTTSPLWVLLVALGGVTGLKLEFVAKTLSIGFAVMTVVLAARHLSLFKYRVFGMLCLVALMANHWFRLAAGSGMEATLAAFLALCIGLQLLETPAPSVWRAARLGVLTGLLMLTRPELFVLPVFFLIAKRAQWRVIPVYLLGLAVSLAPWFVFAWYTFGTCVPNTVIIKSVLVASNVPLLHAGFVSALRLLVFYGAANAVEVAGILMLIWLFLTGAGGRANLAPSQNASDRRADREIPWPVWGLLLIIPFVYFVNQTRGGEAIAYRYAAPALPIQIFLGWLGLEAVYERLKNQPVRKILIVGVAAMMLVSNVTLSILHIPSLKRSVQYLEYVLADYGRWLKLNTRPEEVVACYDVGAIAYYSDRPVLDLIGLNSVEVIRFEAGRVQDIVKSAAIREFKPAYLVTRFPISPDIYPPVMPPYETVLTRSVQAYRFELSAIFNTPSSCDVNLLRLHWPNSL